MEKCYRWAKSALQRYLPKTHWQDHVTVSCKEPVIEIGVLETIKISPPPPPPPTPPGHYFRFPIQDTRGCWDCDPGACPVKPGDGSGSSKLSEGGNTKLNDLKFGSFRDCNQCLGKVRKDCPMFFATVEKTCVLRPSHQRKFHSTRGEVQGSCYVSAWG